MTPGYSCNTVALIGESCKLFFNGVEHIEITDETEVSVSINIVYHDPFDRAKKYKVRILAIKAIKGDWDNEILLASRRSTELFNVCQTD